MLNQELTSDITHLITGGTVNWSPNANLTNKFTVGYDQAEIENRRLDSNLMGIMDRYKVKP